VAFSVDQFFARSVKVELLQHILLVTDLDGTTGRIVDLDGMPIVDDMEGGRFVVELDGGQICRLGISYVDGRLMLTYTYFASRIFWFQIAPMRRTFGALIGPGVACIVGLRIQEIRGSEDQEQQETVAKSHSFSHPSDFEEHLRRRL